MKVAEREALCNQLAADKRRLGLPLGDVRRIDAFLAEKHGITLPLPPDKWEKRLNALAGKTLAKRYWDVHERQALCLNLDRDIPPDLEKAFYNILADKRISGHVHSQKRAEILDAACLLVHLVRALRISGPILDVGCHTGHHAHLLAAETTAAIRGIDLSPKAIAAAQSRAADTPRLSFSVGSLTAPPLGDEFEMVYAVRSIPLDARTAHEIAAVLQPGGVAVVLPQVPPETAFSEQESTPEAGLGWGFSDVVGGWKGEQRGFEAGPVFVLIKGGSKPVPDDATEQATSVWDQYFKDYANEPSTPSAEKTQAYHRGRWMAQHGLDMA